jgi:hypothetical protein
MADAAKASVDFKDERRIYERTGLVKQEGSA